MGEAAECPFCGPIPIQDEYGILLHMETKHPEDTSLFVPSSKANEGSKRVSRGKGRYGPRPPEDSGSNPGPPTSKRMSHQREVSAPTSPSPATKQSSTRRPYPQSNVVRAWRNIFSAHKSRGSKDSRRVRHRAKKPEGAPNSPTTVRSEGPESGGLPASSPKHVGISSRLGKAELGRHVNEQRMPEWLVALLNKGGAVCSEGIIPVLQQLLELSPSTRYAYVCSPCVHHVSKLRREGSFCGYRNIQMLVSYIINSKSTGSELFADSFPSIFQIQDLIENAWDNGFNAQGRVETGGIRGTRKYIGTPEAQAIFSSLQVPCSVQAFKDKDGVRARSLLFKAVESYFRQGAGNDTSKVSPTALPPIYFQHRGHSLTIVGFERSKEGQPNLLVFDPSFRDSSVVRGLVGRTVRQPESKVGNMLDAYRRGNKYLCKYSEFEVLYLTESTPQT